MNMRRQTEVHHTLSGVELPTCAPPAAEEYSRAWIPFFKTSVGPSAATP